MTINVGDTVCIASCNSTGIVTAVRIGRAGKISGYEVRLENGEARVFAPMMIERPIIWSEATGVVTAPRRDFYGDVRRMSARW